MKLRCDFIVAIGLVSGCSANGQTADVEGITKLPTPPPRVQSFRRNMARAAIRQEGLLDKLPEFQKGQPLEPFAASLEQLCGLEAGSMLSAVGQTRLVLRPQEGQQAKENSGCVLMAILGSGLEQAGIEITFPTSPPGLEPREP